MIMSKYQIPALAPDALQATWTKDSAIMEKTKKKGGGLSPPPRFMRHTCKTWLHQYDLRPLVHLKFISGS
jgi:hypothetical protein